jgi:hypothetical protein
MSTYRFEPVIARRHAVGKCPVCGKRVTRSRNFENTISPFNRNEDGTRRTRAEVRQNVELEADQWTPDFTHAACVKDPR